MSLTTLVAIGINFTDHVPHKGGCGQAQTQ